MTKSGIWKHVNENKQGQRRWKFFFDQNNLKIFCLHSPIHVWNSFETKNFQKGDIHFEEEASPLTFSSSVRERHVNNVMPFTDWKWRGTKLSLLLYCRDLSPQLEPW